MTEHPEQMIITKMANRANFFKVTILRNSANICIFCRSGKVKKQIINKIVHNHGHACVTIKRVLFDLQLIELLPVFLSLIHI